MLNETPKANRLHISFFGRRNVGKSSLMNGIVNQPISLVSNTLGTTTDPVEKAMELIPIGPVLFIDTAGIDDEGDIGELRIQKTNKVIDRTDMAILVFSPEYSSIEKELEWFKLLSKRNIPILGVVNKTDKYTSNLSILQKSFPIKFIEINAYNKSDIEKIKEFIISNSPKDFEKDSIVGDIVKPKDLVVLVAPQNIQAPKGRLILPQVQVIRDILDHDALALTVKDTELETILSSLNRKPDLVITDSQVFDKVNKILPDDIPLTSFSILFARYKGDLSLFVKGADSLKKLKDGDNVLIAEACTHHAQKNDIAREQLPMLIQRYCNCTLNIDVSTGSDLPEDLDKYKLIIHCGSCMITRTQLLSRLDVIKKHNIATSNFGVIFSAINGIMHKSCDFLIK